MDTKRHLIPEKLPVGRGTCVYWSTAQFQTSAVVFVHGFRGKALSSWGDTPDIMADDPRFEATDLFYFGYDSRGRQIPGYAHDLRVLLKGIAAWDENLLGRSVAFKNRNASTSYDPILVVGHSLGAVVARRAILDGLKENEDWATRARLALFAPAHMGAFSIKTLIDLTVSKLPGPFDAWIRTRYPVLNQLEPGSQALANLREETIASLPT